MQRVLSLLARQIDNQLPESIKDNAESLRRARLVLSFALVLQLNVVVFLPILLVLGAFLLASVAAFFGVALLALPWVLRRYSLVTAIHVEMSLVLGVFMVCAFFSGGPLVASLHWLALPTVMATMSAGRGAGRSWLVVSIVAMATAGLVEAFGLRPLSVIPPYAVKPLSLASLGMLALVLYALSVVYESTQRRMQLALDVFKDEMRRVLDSVGQGFFIADSRGVPSGQCSAILTSWFGARPAAAAAPFWAWIASEDTRYASWTALGWASLYEGILPTELNVAQLPHTFRDARGRVFGMEYRPSVNKEGAVLDVTVVVSDLTERSALDAVEQQQREHLRLFEQLTSDRDGFLQFWDESTSILDRLRAGDPAPKRLIHTLKGISAVYGADGVASACHDVESRLLDVGSPCTAEDVATITSAWTRATEGLTPLLARARERYEVNRDDYRALQDALTRRAPLEQISELLSSWRLEKTADSFARIAEQARALARRLGKAPLDVTIRDHALRLDPSIYASLWVGIVHAVRNAVDHGIETTDERVAAGKPPRAHLRLESRVELDTVVLEIADDGRGIDWDLVRDAAAARCMPHHTHPDLVRALFSGGITTRDEVSETSGRGVGLAALADVARKLHVDLDIVSPVLGGGTCLRVLAPSV